MINEAKHLKPRPNLKRPNKTLYFTVKVYAVRHCTIFNFMIQQMYLSITG